MAQPKLSDEAMKRRVEYNNRYRREHNIGKCITFNKSFPEDMELLEWVRAQDEPGNVFIKRLIKEDMERRKNV